MASLFPILYTEIEGDDPKNQSPERGPHQPFTVSNYPRLSLGFRSYLCQRRFPSHCSGPAAMDDLEITGANEETWLGT